MSPFNLLILSIIQFLIYSLEVTSNNPLAITKICINQPKLKSKSVPTRKTWKWVEDETNRKQYELVNKSWRKTNIFLDVEASTVRKPLTTTFGKIYQTKPSPARHFNSKRSITPSIFEFYYRDEIDPLSVTDKNKNMNQDKNKANKKRLSGTPKSNFQKYPLKGFGGFHDTNYNNKHSLLPPTPVKEDRVTKSKLFDNFDNFFSLRRRPKLTAKLQQLPTSGKASPIPITTKLQMLPTSSKTSPTSLSGFDHLFERLQRFDSDIRPKRKTIIDGNINYNKNISTSVFVTSQVKIISKNISTKYENLTNFVKNMNQDKNKANKKSISVTPKSNFIKYPSKGFGDTYYNNKHSLLPPMHVKENRVTKSNLFDSLYNFFSLRRRPKVTAKLQKFPTSGKASPITVTTKLQTLPTNSKASPTPLSGFDHLFDRLKRFDSDIRPKRMTIIDGNTNYNENISTTVFIPSQVKNVSKNLSIFNDKVKFFETYDYGTKNFEYNIEKMIFNKNLSNLVNKTTFKTANSTTDNTEVLETANWKEPIEIDNDRDKTSKDSISWENYPFVAAYIYKPLHVYCDAAALTSHWVITSGHCLSHTKNKNMYGKTHSAYVTYCGSNWKEPERISYVKFSVIHPKFDANDEERKYLYNVGVVQVVTPMSTCPGWTPVIMVSHQFLPTNDASTVTIIGWGLDRFKGELTKRRQIFSADTESVTTGDCIPERLLPKQDLNTNLYCLRKKEEGHVHGSLMMSQGRLVALFLQEIESRFDQYTGLWKVVTWLNQVIKEPPNDEFLPYN